MIKRTNGTIWHVDICIRGQRVRQSCHTTDKTKAQEYHDKLKAQLWDKEYLGKTPIPTWDEAIKVWKGIKRNKKSFNKDYAMVTYFNKYFTGITLDKLPISKALINKQVSESTLNRYKAFIRSLFNLVNRELNLSIPLPNLRFSPEAPREVYLTKSEYELLCRNLPDKIQRVVMLAVETGLRRNNLVSLSRHNVDTEQKVVQLERTQTKNGQPVSLPLSNKALSLLESLNFTVNFTDKDYRAFRKAAAEIGKPELRFHDLRHTFATWKAQLGVPLDVIGKLLAHKSTKTVERYRHYSIEDLKQYV